ncbi:efflux RND transporter periplasmic adaptor subunit [Marinomonas sp. 15G1-11]|uniref:Efflux RND transporter periplasmic adaptor subunit n=1 Tax=Marinomonas phaeophyticola TaxID=3004091 RepID=A0ABT4JST5_9GAMM|nr:efflux RND transporter periplasmic adaptor subunit [Marinomonas sp. 15G1-11]MCZ2721434.1 efflux RND transporter periplasmic adaptor subunit [Marinomonas sp. 15G1-11]
MKSSIKNSMVIGAVLSAILLLSACSSEDETVVETKPDIIRPVKLFTINTQNAVDIRRFPGELKASQEADLAFRVGGQLQTLNAIAGKKVKKGELLAQLDPKDFQLKVDLAEANYRLAKATFNRVQSVYKQNATTQAQYDEAKASLDQAENALTQAKNQLSYTQLTAPFDGVISTVSTENFQYVNATQALIHIQNINQLDVVFQVPEKLIINIQSHEIAYKPSVVIDAAPSNVLIGKYKKHNTTPDDTTKAYDVTLSLQASNDKSITLLPGMTASIDINIGELLGAEKNILVPVEAVLEAHTPSGEANRMVWVFNPETNRVESRTITIGALQEDTIEVIDGLKDGDRIVSAGVHSLNKDIPVRPWTRERGI